MTNLLWPRLGAAASNARLDDLKSVEWAQLGMTAASRHPGQTYASTGGVRVDDDRVHGLRQLIWNVASRHGFPGPMKDMIPFDRDLAPLLQREMPMTVGEASTRSVWTFVSLMVAPDVTHWRFGFGNRERWICSDRTRHMFSRLWWQAYLFTDPADPDVGRRLLSQLSESELNQLLERTSIGGCRPLLRALAEAIVNLAPEDRSRDVVRDSSLRLLRLMAILDPYGLEGSQLRQVVERVVGESVTALRQPKRR